MIYTAYNTMQANEALLGYKRIPNDIVIGEYLRANGKLLGKFRNIG